MRLLTGSVNEERVVAPAQQDPRGSGLQPVLWAHAPADADGFRVVFFTRAETHLVRVVPN